jgi:hypothetical protein
VTIVVVAFVVVVVGLVGLVVSFVSIGDIHGEQLGRYHRRNLWNVEHHRYSMSYDLVASVVYKSDDLTFSNCAIVANDNI